MECREMGRSGDRFDRPFLPLVPPPGRLQRKGLEMHLTSAQIARLDSGRSQQAIGNIKN